MGVKTEKWGTERVFDRVNDVKGKEMEGGREKVRLRKHSHWTRDYYSQLKA